MKVLALTLTFAVAMLFGWLVSKHPSESTTLNSRHEKTQSTTSQKTKAAAEVTATFQEIKKLDTYSDQALFTIALASSLPIEDLEHWLSSEALKSLDDRLSHLFREIASHRWIEEQPKEYLEWARLHHSDSLKKNLPHVALRDPELAVEFIDRNSSFSFPLMVRELLALDPDLAVRMAEEHLSTHPDPEFEPHDSLVMSALAKVDLEASLRVLEKLPANKKKNAATGIFSVLLKQDFQKGLDFFQKQNLSVENLFSALTSDPSGETSRLLVKHHEDLPGGLLEKLFNSSELGYRTTGLLPLIEIPREVLGINDEAFQNLCRQLTHSYHSYADKPMMMKLINSSHVPLETREGFLLGQIQRWPEWDSEGLRSWLGTLEAESLFQHADQALEEKDAKASPDYQEIYSPVDRFRNIISGEEKNSFSSGFWTPDEMREVKSQFHQLNPEERKRCFEFFGDENGLDSLPFDFSSLLLSDALKHQNIDSAEALIGQLESFASHWARFKTAATADWVKQLPDGPDKISAAREVARVWAEHDPDEAHIWVETFPEQEQAKILSR